VIWQLEDTSFVILKLLKQWKIKKEMILLGFSAAHQKIRGG